MWIFLSLFTGLYLFIFIISVYSGFRMVIYEGLRDHVFKKNEDGSFPLWQGIHEFYLTCQLVLHVNKYLDTAFLQSAIFIGQRVLFSLKNQRCPKHTFAFLYKLIYYLISFLYLEALIQEVGNSKWYLWSTGTVCSQSN